MASNNIIQNSPKAWLLAARPKTLSGAAVPVMIGTALAYTDSFGYEGDVFNWLPAVLCFLFAFIMQINANFINDFFDYIKGTDNVEFDKAVEFLKAKGGKIFVLEIAPAEISSSEIRQMKFSEMKRHIPAFIAKYISENGLYGGEQDAK